MARRRDRSIYKILECLVKQQNIQDALSEILILAVETVGAEAGALFPGHDLLDFCSETVLFNLPEKSLKNKPLTNELIVGLGLQEDRPVVISDYERYVFAHKDLVELGVKAVAAAPLVIEGSIAGLIALFQRSEAVSFSDRDSRFLYTVAGMISLRLENLRLSRTGRTFKDEVATVQRASSSLTASLELPKVLDSILATAHDLVPADLAHIFLYSDNTLRFGAASGADGRWDKPYAEPRREGLTYKVAETGQPIVVEDIRSHPLYKGSPSSWSGSIVGLPLKVKERVVGVMNISRFVTATTPFSEEELRILNMLADQAAIAVENARLYETERTQRQRIEAMQSAVATLSQSLDLSEVLARILTELRRVIPYDSAAAMLLERNSLRVVAGRDLPENSAIGERYPVSEIEREIERTGRPFILDDASADERFKGWGNTDYVKGWMSVPLLGREGLIGCLTIDSRRVAAYSEEEADLAMSFAHQAAIAVENAQLHQSVKDQLDALQASQIKLIQSEKMAAIGKLVAGVAHELNNPLTAIIGIAQLLQSGHISETVKQDLEKLVGEAHRAGKIVRSLLDFSRQQRTERQPVQINDVLNNTLKILAYQLESHDIKLQTEFSEDLPSTMADAHQLQQVFINLVNNAYEAMHEASGGGILSIRSEAAQINGADGERASRPGIRVIVKDDGPGISADMLPMIFDPFYTTKSPGKGTGLGLSVCHGIISEHEGQILVESTPGEGACFTVQIPIVAAVETGEQTDNGSDEVNRQPGRARILVVEDEVVIRELVLRILKRVGFEVDTCPDGLEALETIEKTKYNLIICDVRMPRLSGIELYEKLKARGSRTAERILFITGDTVSHDTQKFMKRHSLPFLGKPFEVEDLVAKVRAELEAPHRT